MYTVLLVDDEDSVLEVLKKSIHWQELGVDKLLAVSDGLTALDCFERQHIDLLITDIRMPRMNGLELIGRVRDISPDTHTILLTAYGEFEYAKQAIALGVENYLLKPVAREEVEQNIRNTLDNIYRKRENSESLLQENVLRRWTAGNIGDEELSDRAAMLGMNLYQKAYCVVCLVKRARGSMAGMCSACAETFAKEYDVWRFWDEKGNYVMILGGREIDTKALTDTLERLAWETETEQIVSAAIGTPVRQALNVRLSYQAACDAIELVDLQTAGVVLGSREDVRGTNADLLAEEIKILFFLPEEESRLQGYRHLAHKLALGTSGGEAFARLVQGCLYVLVNEFPNYGGIQEKVYHHSVSGVWDGEEAHLEQAAVVFLQKVYGIFAECFDAYTPIVRRVVLYIRNCVLGGEGVSLKEFCGQNGMNPAYIGHMFKGETGVFFNDYLNRCRIERAIVLLRNPNRMVKDIAEEVGFTNTSYFVKCFREQKGISPAKYRQELLGMQKKGSRP
ncbi:MAG: response regulator [Eubacteriales bacterium]|nr:response regulator [Eubacteriales bacterium]